MNSIKKVVINEDSFFVIKGIFGYRVVHPIKREDGSINWFNLFTGGWGNLIFVLVVVSFLLWVLVDTHNQIEVYRTKCILAMEQPVEFCRSVGFYDAVEKLKKIDGGFNLTYND